MKNIKKQQAARKSVKFAACSLNHKLGIAFDIGTTTVVGSLISLETSREIDTAALSNPQSRLGKDVLSRVQRIMEDAANLKVLQCGVVDACNSIIRALERSSRSLRGNRRSEEIKNEIGLITVAGNSVMEHILLGISPVSLAKVPYRPAFKEAMELSAADLGLDVPRHARLYAFPLIGGFIGGDTVADILATGLHKKRKASFLVIDIGTNSEIVLSANGRLYATSAAAGPAFEGGAVKCGMIAKQGAIQGINIIGGDKLILDVIGGVSPEGICGSGVIDIVAQLLNAGIIDATGRMKSRREVDGNLANRIRESSEGNSFLLYRDARVEVVVTQNDVREVQLAKAAIQAGIKLLLKKAETDAKEIEKIFIAGAFGSSVKKESIARIGVIKEEWLDRVVFAGDAALEGAKLALCSEKNRGKAERIAQETRHLPLSGSRSFQREFLKGMEFH